MKPLDGGNDIVFRRLVYLDALLAGIEVELSLVPLYEGQPLWSEVSDLLRQFGFAPLALGHGFRDPGTGELLQLDGLFGRAENGSAAEAGAW